MITRATRKCWGAAPLRASRVGVYDLLEDALDARLVVVGLEDKYVNQQIVKD